MKYAAGMRGEDAHAILKARARELGVPDDHSCLLGIAEEWIAAACREVPNFATWLDHRPSFVRSLEDRRETGGKEK